MHLLVLSAFRHVCDKQNEARLVSQCTFWCSVLSDIKRQLIEGLRLKGLNAPFGAQCFPTPNAPPTCLRTAVSMHLLVLSAFRHWPGRRRPPAASCLNAPFGAQCFPTRIVPWQGQLQGVSMHLLVLSAFRRKSLALWAIPCPVSMHLLVLSAFRP